MLIAALARDGTAAAKRGVTVLAAVAIVFGDRVAAIIAGDAVPVVQLHVGTAAAIGLQQPGNHEEEIVQAAPGQRGRNRRPALALAELLALDMGMGDAVVLGSGMGIQRHDAIGLRAGAQLLPVQPDLERPQVDAVQLDRVGRYEYLVVREVDPYDVELLVQCQNIAVDVRGAGHVSRPDMWLDGAGGVFQLVLKSPQRAS